MPEVTPDTAPPTRPLNREEILMLKVAELILQRDSMDRAVRSLLSRIRPAGKSGYQAMVLTSDVEELRRRADDSMRVTWPALPGTSQ